VKYSNNNGGLPVGLGSITTESSGHRCSRAAVLLPVGGTCIVALKCTDLLRERALINSTSISNARSAA
jgi:hypothetical protein